MPQQPFGAGMQVPSMCFFDEPSSNGVVDFYLLSRVYARQYNGMALIFAQQRMDGQPAAYSQQSFY
jgi:hypothetical protein